MNYKLSELYRMLYILENAKTDENYDQGLYDDINTEINKRLYEDTGGPSVDGMGSFVSAQPSTLAGTTVGPSWSDNGGTVGSGDVSTKINLGTGKLYNMTMGKNHGSRTGKKSRTKKLDLKTIKANFAKKQDYTKSEKPKRVLDFNDFLKNDFNTIKK